MSEITQARDWARKMQAATHRPDCRVAAGAMGSAPGLQCFEWTYPDPECEGCVSDGDRALWKRIADEFDGYLGRPTTAGAPT